MRSLSPFSDVRATSLGQVSKIYDTESARPGNNGRLGWEQVRETRRRVNEQPNPLLGRVDISTL